MENQEKSSTFHENHQQFDYGSYLRRRFSAPRGIIDEERGVQPFYLQCYHDFYSKFNSEWDVSQARLLELGGGPTIYPLISAAPHVSEIVFSDYVEGNLDQVRLWKEQSSAAHDWTPYLKYVVNTLEGEQDKGVALQREIELRGKVKLIKKCNILEEDPANIVEGNGGIKYDIISFNFCCETVFDTPDAYGECLRKVGGLLKPRGFIASLVSEEESCYTDGTEQYQHLFLTAEDIHEHYETAGFTIRYSSRFPIPEKACNILNDCKAIHFIVGQK